MPLDLHTLSVIIFIIIVAIILLRDKKKVKRESIVFFRRTQRGRELLTRVGENHPTFWKAVGNIAVIAGFAGSFFMLFVLTILAINNIVQPVAQQGLALVLPTPGTEALVGTGYIGVPFWFWIIAISILMVVHEGLHGVMAAREKVRIKSLGLVLLAFIPGAFVEPDERQMRRKPLMARLRIFASGSFANFCVGAAAGMLILLLTGILSVPFLGNFTEHTGGMLYGVSPAGVGYGLVKGYPASAANLTGMITAVNGMQVKTGEDVRRLLGDVAPGTTAAFSTTKGNYTLIAQADMEDPERGLFGFSRLFTLHAYDLKEEYRGMEQLIAVVVGTYPFGLGGGWKDIQTGGLLFWVYLINVGVGMFNLLPVRVLDGGLMWQAVLEKLSRPHAKRIMNLMTAFILVVIFANFAGAFGLV